MACRYVFTDEQIQEMTNAAKGNKRKDVDRRLRALLMRAKGNTLAKIAQATGYSFSNITKLVRVYRADGLVAIAENHYGGNHRNMSYEEEAALLKPFKQKAEAGQVVEVSEIKAVYQKCYSSKGHKVNRGVTRRYGAKEMSGKPIVSRSFQSVKSGSMPKIGPLFSCNPPPPAQP